jgi:hypothetical protein
MNEYVCFASLYWKSVNLLPGFLSIHSDVKLIKLRTDLMGELSILFEKECLNVITLNYCLSLYDAYINQMNLINYKLANLISYNINNILNDFYKEAEIKELYEINYNISKFLNAIK